MRETTGGRLREERERLGLSQRAMAALGGVSKNTQLAYESGTSPLPIDYVLKLEEHGVDPSYVATGTRASAAKPREERSALEQPQLVTMQVALPSVAALTRMFEGLLRPLSREMSVGELAETLARRLPIGLAQVQDLRDARGWGAASEDDEAPRARATDGHESQPARRT